MVLWPLKGLDLSSPYAAKKPFKEGHEGEEGGRLLWNLGRIAKNGVLY